MESLDRLLAELKAEYQESKKKSAELKSQPTMPAEPPSPAVSVPSTQPIQTVNQTLNYANVDNDLAKIKAEYAAQDKAQELAKQEQLKAEYEKLNKTQESAKQEQLKVEYKEPNKAQEIVVKQEQQIVEKVVEKPSHLQTHREKVRQAQVWLKNLDKNSDERFWFDQFAFKYSSRIDAAIDYLQAVNEFD
jgi:23S rRNA-/tRNA-specific pseudouridylate synthase